MSSGVNRLMVGSFNGTGSAITIKGLGFPQGPRVVELRNVDGNAIATYIKPMADASMQKAADSGAGETDLSFETTNGITPVTDGFTVGADTDLNVSGELVYYAAFE
jgi:hypothetical protein